METAMISLILFARPHNGRRTQQHISITLVVSDSPSWLLYSVLYHQYPMNWLFYICLVMALASMWLLPPPIGYAEGQHRRLRRPLWLSPTPALQASPRHLQLQEPERRDVALFLALYWLDDPTAVQLEGRDAENELVAHFCQAVNIQVRCPCGLTRVGP